jgi:hypothetical protein
LLKKISPNLFLLIFAEFGNIFWQIVKKPKFFGKLLKSQKNFGKLLKRQKNFGK